jgi:hypothetical protein
MYSREKRPATQTNKDPAIMSDNQLNDFITAQHATNLSLTSSMSRIEQSMKDTNQRLFGGDGQKGVLPFVVEKHDELEKRMGTVETWKTGTVKWVAGVIAVLTLEGSALALYFNYLSGKLPH